MLFSKQDYEYLLNSLSKKFALYEFIDNNYLSNMLNNLINNGCFEDLKISSEDLSKDMNPLFNISFRIQNYLYYKICKLAEEDIDVLLTLVEDKRKIVILVLRKLKIDDFSKVDDYIMEIVSLYNGVESFDSFVTRYVMSVIKGVKFEVEKAPIVCSVKVLEITDKKYKKSKKKKNKNKQEIIVSVNETKYDEMIEDDLGKDIFDKQEDKSWFQKCLDKCNEMVGTNEKDNFIIMVLASDLVDKVMIIDDEYYKIYFLMRFGLVNTSFYTREEIAIVMEVSLEEVIKYERYTLGILKKYINRIINDYEEFILRK